MMVESTTCGEDSKLNTGNTKFHYCVPSDGSQCTIGDTTTPEQSVAQTCSDVTEYAECDSNPCDCTSDDNCNECQSWGCVTCADGYFKKSWGHECVSCTTFDANCNQCNDWNGCTQCNYGYSVTWDNDCGLNICA